MKRILFLIFLFTISINFVEAKQDNKYYGNAVYLDLNDISENQEIVQKDSVTNDKMDIEYSMDQKQKEYNTLLYKDVNRMQTEKKTVSKSLEKEILKGASVGTTYSTTEKSGKLDDSVSLYSKYKKDKFALTTSYSQSRDGLKDNGVGNGSVSLAPELTLNERVKLKNVYTDNLNSNKQTSEVVLSIRPFKDDRMDLDLGAGETFSSGNEPAKSQINIGTKFRF